MNKISDCLNFSIFYLRFLNQFYSLIFRHFVFCKDEQIKPIGRGTSGVVYLIRRKRDNKQFVWKNIQLSNPEANISVENELVILKTDFDSPFIIKYVDSFRERNNMYIVLEHCGGGNLRAEIMKRQELRKPYTEKV